ncbi:MAG: ABC transporter permease subunit [Roseiarcus sp.]
MLVWSRSGRFVVWLVAALLIGVIFLAPLAVILAASLARQWNGVLPTGFTFEHYRDAGSGASGEAVLASLITGFVASLLALLCGSWAALSLRAQGEAWSRSLGLLFFIPSAVPSVSVGLGLLVAFSQRPLLLNGTTAIVILAHFVLISAFSFGNVSAGLARLPPDYEEVASSLGARPTYRLFNVTLPLITPYLIAAFGLSFALSMGELGATVMVYPPGWVTLPVAIFGLTDRGDIFSGAALTMILIGVTLALLVALERLPAERNRPQGVGEPALRALGAPACGPHSAHFGARTRSGAGVDIPRNDLIVAELSAHARYVTSITDRPVGFTLSSFEDGGGQWARTKIISASGISTGQRSGPSFSTSSAKAF